MAYNETWLSHDMKNAVKVKYLDGNVFSNDNAGNLIGVILTVDGVNYADGGTVDANVIRADGVTVPVSGALSGNIATVILPQAAYAVPGVLSIVMKLKKAGAITTIAAVVANVYQSSTDAIVDPGTIIPSIETLIAEIEAAVASIPADYSDLWTTLAPAFSATTAYVKDQYVTYDGGMYRFVVNHAAGSWSASDVVAVKIGNELTYLKNSVDNITGCEQLRPTGRYGYIATNSSPVNTSTVVSVVANWAYYVIPCAQGDIFTINGTGGSTPRLWCFINASGNIIKNSGENATATDLVLVTPHNATKLVVNDVSEVGTVFKGRTVPHIVSEVFSWYEVKGLFYLGVMNTSGAVLSETGYHCIFNVEEGKQYAVSGRSFNMSPPAYCLWIFKDSNGAIIDYDSTSTADTVYTDVPVTAPAGATTLIVNTYQVADAGLKIYSSDDTYKFANKRVLWLGTSIPEGNVYPPNGYPNIIGDMLHCLMINNSVGASSARIGDPDLVTTANICGVKNLNGLRNLTQTKAEKDTLIDNWETICGELGISYTPISSEERAAYKRMSYEDKLVPYLTSPNTVDLVVLNHCYNDAYVNSPLTTQPPTPYDRLYFYGAINFLVKLIRETNPDIKIAIFGHYQATFEEALAYEAQYWYLPYYKLWDRLGWAEKAINVTKRVNSSGAWETVSSTELTIKNQWVYDTVHPKGVASQRIADVGVSFIRDLFGAESAI